MPQTSVPLDDPDAAATPAHPGAAAHVATLWQVLLAIRQYAPHMALGVLLLTGVTVGLTGLVSPSYMAVTTFVPPQPLPGHPSAISLIEARPEKGDGTVHNLPGEDMAETVVSLLRSHWVADRIIDQFSLRIVLNAPLLTDARSRLARRVRIQLRMPDGLVRIQVHDPDPKRAADIANRYVGLLQELMQSRSDQEARHRRQQFQQRLTQARRDWQAARTQLESSPFGESDLQALPDVQAERLMALQALITAQEARLQVLRTGIVDDAFAVQREIRRLNALQNQLADLTARASPGLSSPQGTTPAPARGDSAYRDFRYQQHLMEVYSGELEAARLDALRRIPIAQVVDPATPPDRPDSPHRAFIATVAACLSSLLAIALVGARALRDAKTIGASPALQPQTT